MKFTINTKDFAAIVARAAKIVEPKGVLPIMTHLAIEAVKKDVDGEPADMIRLRAMSNDCHLGLYCNAQVEEAGGVAIASVDLARLVATLKASPTLTLQASDKATRCQIKGEKSNHSVNFFKISDFPARPDYDRRPTDFEGPATSMVLPSDLLRRMAAKVAPAAAGALGYLGGTAGGITMEFSPEERLVRLAASNPRLLSYAEIDCDDQVPKLEPFELPQSALDFLEGIDKKTLGVEVIPSADGNKLCFHTGEPAPFDFTAVRIVSSKPAIAKAKELAAKSERKAIVNTEELLEAVKSVAIIADAKAPKLKLQSNDEGSALTVWAGNRQGEEASAGISAEGDLPKVCVDPVLFGACLATIDAERTLLAYNPSPGFLVIIPDTTEEAVVYGHFLACVNEV